MHLPRLKRQSQIKTCGCRLSVSGNADTLLDGNAARKNHRFLTALHPRQYHPSVLEKPLIKRFFAYKVFFRRACLRKNKKCGVTAAKNFQFVFMFKFCFPNCRIIFLPSRIPFSAFPQYRLRNGIFPTSFQRFRHSAGC